MKKHKDSQGDPLTEKDVYTAIGSSLTNAKDWDGFRAQRVKKRDDCSRNE